jgi:hypothetical protein
VPRDRVVAALEESARGAGKRLGELLMGVGA